MVRGLRRGLFRDSMTLHEVLSAAARRHDRHILWEDPNLPAVGRIRQSGLEGFLSILQHDSQSLSRYSSGWPT